MNAQRGFTLLELLITVLVLGVVASLAAPSFNAMIQRNRLSAAANELAAGLQTTRMEAIRTNARVEMCPSINGTACGGTDWGRFIVVSQKGGVARTIRDVQLNTASLSITPSIAVSQSKVWFMSDGFLRTGTNAAPTRIATLGVCSTRLNSANVRDVQINVSRISVSRTTRATCAAPAN